MCRMFCPFGWKQSVDGCPLCECFDPCEAVECAENEKCVSHRANSTLGMDMESGRHECVAVKAGTCPAMEGMMGICTDSCSADSDCEGEEKCCSNGCGHACMAPVPVAPSCPIVMCLMFCPFGWKQGGDGCPLCECYNPCEGVECAENEECFSHRVDSSLGMDMESGRHDCIVIKTGICPAMDGMMGTCTEMCSSDGDCEGEEKCCSNGCGHSCMAPAVEVKLGICPVMEGMMGTCDEMCSTDSDCEGEEKCCSNGCGHACMAPAVVEKPGNCPAMEGMMGICVDMCSSDSDCEGEEKCCSNGCGHTCMAPAAEGFVRPEQCMLPMTIGPCRGRISRWYFDADTERCVEFFYGGCRGNNNNFETQGECEDMCTESEVVACPDVMCARFCENGFRRDEDGCATCDCTASKCEDVQCDPGHECEELEGCEGDDCYMCSPAAPTCPVMMCFMFCQYGWKQGADNCPLCQCYNPCEGVECAQTEECVSHRANSTLGMDMESGRHECVAKKCPSGSPLTEPLSGREIFCGRGPGRQDCPDGYFCNIEAADRFAVCCEVDEGPALQDLCLLPREVGRCRGAMQRWFYSTITAQCEQFSYGGCEGNDNNFESEEDCRAACSLDEVDPPSCPDVMCAMYCRFGFKQDEDGCAMCSCFQPCEGVDCETGTRCVESTNDCTEFPCIETGTFECTSACEPPDCDHECPHGHVQDQAGCDTCQCQECPLPDCEEPCQSGYVTDEMGCQTCECLDPCQDNNCRADQRCIPEDGGGYVCRDNCRPVRCRMACQFGFKSDENGCEYCECSDPCNDMCVGTEVCMVQADGSYQCVDRCPAIMCLIPCDFGMAQDALGCPSCDCLPHPCVTDPCDVDEFCHSAADNTRVCTRMEDLCATTECDTGHCVPVMTDCPHEPFCRMTTMCVDDPEKCQQDKQNAINRFRLNTGLPVYVPQCQENGLFEEVQVNDFTGLSWCVDVTTGEKVDGTTTRGMPKCDEPMETEEDVCPGKSPYNMCSPLLCEFASCSNPEAVSAVCRVNPCGDQCTPEFFDPVTNTRIECQERYDDMTDCQRKMHNIHQHISTSNDRTLFGEMLLQWFTDEMNHPNMPEPYDMPEQPEPEPTEMMSRSPMGPMSTTSMPMFTTRTERVGPVGPIGPGRGPAPWEGEEEPLPPGVPGWRPRPAPWTRTMSTTTTNPPLPPRASAVIADLVAGVSMPLCTHRGDFDYKQCHGDLCWCVNSEGVPVDHTMVSGELSCTEKGKDPYNSGGNPIECSNGVLPYPCPDACQTASCNHPNPNIKCHVSICHNCAVIFTDETGQEVTCLPEADCSWVEASDWYFSDSEMVCTQNFAGDDCAAMTFYKTRTYCVWNNLHKFAVNPDCADMCLTQTCRGDPQAICVVDNTDCSTFFLDTVDNLMVDCSRVKGVCERNRVYMHNQGRTENLHECDDLGNYAGTQCDDTRTCWCVDKRGLEIPNTRRALKYNQKLECTVKFPSSIIGTLVLQGDFSIVNNNLPEFKRIMQNEISLAVNVSPKWVIIGNVREGSVIVDYRIYVNSDDETATSATLAEVDSMTMAANRGEFITEFQGETLTSSSANYDLDYPDPPAPPARVVEDEEESLEPGYIALIVICAVLVLVIIIGAVMCCRSREKKEKQERWRVYNQQISKQGLVSSRASTSSGSSSLSSRPPSYDPEKQAYDNPSYISGQTNPNAGVAEVAYK